MNGQKKWHRSKISGPTEVDVAAQVQILTDIIAQI